MKKGWAAWLINVSYLPMTMPDIVTGISLMLLTTLLRGVMSVWQAWVINNATDGYASVSGMMGLFSAVGMLIGVVSAAGLVMLAWGACKAMQATRTA